MVLPVGFLWDTKKKNLEKTYQFNPTHKTVVPSRGISYLSIYIQIKGVQQVDHQMQICFFLGGSSSDKKRPLKFAGRVALGELCHVENLYKKISSCLQGPCQISGGVYLEDHPI